MPASAKAVTCPAPDLFCPHKPFGSSARWPSLLLEALSSISCPSEAQLGFPPWSFFSAQEMHIIPADTKGEMQTQPSDTVLGAWLSGIDPGEMAQWYRAQHLGMWLNGTGDRPPGVQWHTAWGHGSMVQLFPWYTSCKQEALGLMPSTHRKIVMSRMINSIRCHKVFPDTVSGVPQSAKIIQQLPSYPHSHLQSPQILTLAFFSPFLPTPLLHSPSPFFSSSSAFLFLLRVYI